MKRAQYRQGDVLLIPVESVPQDAIQESPDGSRVVLAYGELTGHAHAMNPQVAVTFQRGQERYLDVKDGAVLRHEEHSPLTLDQGVYRVVIQREYEPAGFRPVAD